MLRPSCLRAGQGVTGIKGIKADKSKTRAATADCAD